MTATPSTSPGEQDHQSCPQCGSTEPWGFASWCPACGYYPALSQSVAAPRPPAEMEAGPQNLWEAIPLWGWILVAGLAVIGALSAGAALTIEAGSGYRSLWTLAQLGVGLILFSIAHATAYMHAVAGTDRLTPFDIFMKPIEVWKPTFQGLPHGSQRVCLAAWGQFAALSALVIVGGVRYSALFDDWGIQERAETNVVQAITSQVREAQPESDGSLEEAVNQFADDEAEDEEEERLAKLPTIDCLIFGYTPDEGGGFSLLLLASLVDGNVEFVGTLAAEELPSDVRRKLTRRLPALEQETPFVTAPYTGAWLRPVLMCRVAYHNWTASKRLREPVFRAMLADLDT